MKYINKRDEFLNIRSSLNPYEILNEYGDGAGPFSNNLGWNDSLLGRLINHSLRKAKVQMDLKNIKKATKRLTETFDTIVSQGIYAKLDVDDKKGIKKIKLGKLFDELKKSVENEDPLHKIKSLTDNTISKVIEIDELKNENGLDEKDTILDELEKFKKFLDGLEETDETDEEETDEETTERKLIIGKVYNYTNNKGNVTPVKILSLDNQIGSGSDKKFLTPDDVDVKPLKKGYVYVQWKDSNGNFSNKSNEMAVKISQIGDEVEETTERKLIIGKVYNYTNNEGNVTPVRILSLDNQIGSGSDKKFLTPDDVDVKPLKKGYVYVQWKDINGYFSNKSSEMAVKISQIGDEVEGNIPLKTYNIDKEKTQQVSVKSEGILNYNKFILLRESEEIKKTDTESKEKLTIKDFFNKNCNNVKSFILDSSEMKKIESEMKKVKESKELKGDFKLDGMDPVIEVVKLFNKAYKIYTVNSISKRSKDSGGVGMGTLSEYTPFNSNTGDDNGKKGPYRNNKVFDKWEDAVLNIFKERKYQFIFLPTTTMRIPNPSNKEKYTDIPKAGENLKKFMTDLLDGDNLYKAGGAGGTGKQKKFLDLYFGGEATKTPIGVLVDKDTNEIQKKIEKIPTIKLKFKKYNDEKIVDRSIFALKLADKDNKEMIEYIYFNEITNGGWAYISLSRSLKEFKKYITESVNPKCKIDKGDMDKITNNTSKLKYSKIEDNEFKILTSNNKIRIKSIMLTPDNEYKKNEGEYTVIDSYYLINENDDKVYSIPDSEKLKSITKDSKSDGIVKNSSESDDIKINKV